MIKLRAYDSHALKCAALAAAMKEEIILDKVPLATALKGVPLLTTAAVRDRVECFPPSLSLRSLCFGVRIWWACLGAPFSSPTAHY